MQRKYLTKWPFRRPFQDRPYCIIYAAIYKPDFLQNPGGGNYGPSGIGAWPFESVYTTCLGIELQNMDLEVRSEVPLPVVYRGQNVTEEGFRLDLLVEDQVIVELKSVEKIQPIHQKQLLTYLRLANKPLGLLINFNETLLKDGITRIINTKKNDKGSGRSAD